jgi:hypothetical protein
LGDLFLEAFARFYMLGSISHAFLGYLGKFKPAKCGEF